MFSTMSQSPPRSCAAVLGVSNVRQLAPDFAGWSLDAVLPQVRCPALVLHGTEDEYGSRRHPERIAQGVAGPAQLELIPEVRHVPHREREAWVAQRVAAFLQAL